MDNTFIKIGEVIRKTDAARIVHHPLLSQRNLAKVNKKGDVTPVPTIAVHELVVDIDNKIVSTVDSDLFIPNKLDVIKFVMSSADTRPKYLIGSYVRKKEEILDQLSLSLFNSCYVKKYKNVLNSGSFIVKYRNTLESGLEVINGIVSKYQNDNNILEIALIIKVTYQNETHYAHEFIDCLDEIDEMFLESSQAKNGNYIFYSAFYSMFNHSKYVIGKIHTAYDESIPYYSKEDFLNLYYARNIYNGMSFFINKDYSISIFPNYVNLSINDIEQLTFKGKDLFNFDEVCKEIQNFINRKIERNPVEKNIIPIKLKFDIYYRYVLGMAGNQNMLRLTGIRYNQLLEIKNRINNEYYPTYWDKESNSEKKYSLYHILTDIYQDYLGKSDRYNTVIIHTLQNIYQEKFDVPQLAEYCLIDRSEHQARMDNCNLDNFKKLWNKLIKIYKFLKTMENKNFVPELLNSPSYKLGVELAKFESGWKNDRINLRATIQQFTGNISKKVYSIDDIQSYYQNLVERMVRNKIKYYDHNELLQLLSTITDNEFEKNKFIMGYFTEKNEYKSRNEENITNN